MPVTCQTLLQALDSAVKKKKEEIYPLATIWMKLKDIMLTKMSGRERQILYELT